MQRLDVAGGQPGREPTTRLSLPAAVVCPRAQGARRVPFARERSCGVLKLSVEPSPRPRAGQLRDRFRNGLLERADPRRAHSGRDRARARASLAQQGRDDFLFSRWPCRPAQPAHLLTRVGNVTPRIPQPQLDLEPPASDAQVVQSARLAPMHGCRQFPQPFGQHA